MVRFAPDLAEIRPDRSTPVGSPPPAVGTTAAHDVTHDGIGNRGLHAGPPRTGLLLCERVEEGQRYGAGNEVALPTDPPGRADAPSGDRGGDRGGDPARSDGTDRSPGAADDIPAPDDGTPAAPSGGNPPVDPFDDADALEELGCRIATLAAHIHAATQRLLVLIAEFDRRRGWELGGHRSCAEWLSFRTGIGPVAAREKVRTARALAGLPETSASMARGELSFSAVRALTRAATSSNEIELLELARGCTTQQIEKVVRAWKKGSRQDEATRERELWQSRTFSVFPDDEGMYVVKGRLPAEVGVLLRRAIDAASDALYRESPGAKVAAAIRPREETRREAARRRADAVGLVAEGAIAAGFGGEDAPISGTRAGRYQVMLHVEPETLQAEGEPGRSELEDGTRVSAETARRLTCDCALVRVEHAPKGVTNTDPPPDPNRDGSTAPDRSEAVSGSGSNAADRSESSSGCGSPDVRPLHREGILSVGRRTRTIPPALRRALEVRDRGCRFPGCGLRYTSTHHVIHWAEGGETSLRNCLLLCRHHHRLVHEGSWRVDWWGDGRPVFFDPRGGTHFEGRWEPPDLGDAPLEALFEQNERHGVRPDGWTAGARWKRERDVPDHVLFAALEAMA